MRAAAEPGLFLSVFANGFEVFISGSFVIGFRSTLRTVACPANERLDDALDTGEARLLLCTRGANLRALPTATLREKSAHCRRRNRWNALFPWGFLLVGANNPAIVQIWGRSSLAGVSSMGRAAEPERAALAYRKGRGSARHRALSARIEDGRRREDNGQRQMTVGSAPYCRIGNCTVTVVPPSRGESTRMVPSCASMRRLAVGRPKPVPPAFVVKNGVKSLSRISAGIPGPLSANAIRLSARRLPTSRPRSAASCGLSAVDQEVQEDDLQQLGIARHRRRASFDIDSNLVQRSIALSRSTVFMTRNQMSMGVSFGCGGRANSSRSFIRSRSARRSAR